jgi:hypothetical protein
MKFEKFVNNKTGKIVGSILLGFGLATLFRQACKGKKCIITKSVPMKEINDQIYKFNDKCYKYSSTPVNCEAQNVLIA